MPEVCRISENCGMPTGSRTSQYKKLGKRKEHAVFDRVLLLLFLRSLRSCEGSFF